MNKSALFNKAHRLAKRTTKKFGGDYSANFSISLKFFYSLIASTKDDVIKSGSMDLIFAKTGANKAGKYFAVKVGSKQFKKYATKGAKFYQEALNSDDITSTLTVTKIGKKFTGEDGQYCYVYYTTESLKKVA